jgi:UDP-2-acetamido-2,6-beta-L-arabino-hexul-4-ose reductase
MTIGITGQNGFLGLNLKNYIKENIAEIEIINFDNNYFLDKLKLDEWVSKCEVIVHFAALSRHSDSSVVYINNIGLVTKLLDSINRTNSAPHLIFSSSKQEIFETGYGKSKREGRELLKMYSIEHEMIFTGLIIPNVFGPFAKPKYASVVATFCYQLINDETPVILNDLEMELIYVEQLAIEIIYCIENKINNPEYIIPFRYKIKVSKILETLMYFKEVYLINNRIPDFKNDFEKKLFATFKSYINYK